MKQLSIPIPESYAKSMIAGVFALFITACSTGTKVTDIKTSVIELSETAAADTNINAIIAPYKNELDKTMSETLAVSETEMIKASPESKLGNFVSDIILKKARTLYNKGVVDFCLINKGGLRTDIPKGPITRSKIFELMPFENEIVVLTLSGQKISEMCSYLARKKGMPVSGLKMGISKDEPVNILINGTAFDPDSNYVVATSDYLAYGGDEMYFFLNPLKYELLNIKIRDAIIQYITEENKKGNKLNPTLDGRIYIAGQD